MFKGDILNFFREFYTNGRLAKGVNSSFITLIPKKENPCGIANYRPINLIGSLYKILSEVLANGFKNVLPRIVGEAQSAFMGGRNILAGVLISNEIIDWWKKRKKRGLILKLDFEKAYDTVNWQCLLDLMSKFGFQDKWVS